MPAQKKICYLVSGAVLGFLLAVSTLIVWALWSGNTDPTESSNMSPELSAKSLVGDNGYPEYEPRILKPGVVESIWMNPLVKEKPDSLDLFEINSDKTVQNAYIVPSEYYVAAAMSGNLGGFYTNHLDKGIDPVLASGDISADEYRRLALGKFYYIYKAIPILEDQIAQRKERNKGADYSGIEFSLVQGKRKINEAITFYNNEQYGEADISAFKGGVWIKALQDMLHEPINEYQRLLTWYETDVDWARSFLSKEDSLTRSKLTKIQEYLDAGDLDTARKLYNEIANNNEIVKAVSTARSLSEDNPQIWGALHWLTADMRVFETVNYDLLSESVPRYSNNIISISELSRRKSSANCYVAVAGFVYDITTLLNFKTLHPALPELETRCGTNVSDYIASQPTQSGSANTARFKWILWWFEIGVLG